MFLIHLAMVVLACDGRAPFEDKDSGTTDCNRINDFTQCSIRRCLLYQKRTVPLQDQPKETNEGSGRRLESNHGLQYTLMATDARRPKVRQK